MKKVSGGTRAVNKHCVEVMKLMSTFPLRRRLTGTSRLDMLRSMYAFQEVHAMKLHLPMVVSRARTQVYALPDNPACFAFDAGS